MVDSTSLPGRLTVGEFGAEVEDLVLVGQAAGVAVGAVEEAGDGAGLCGRGVRRGLGWVEGGVGWRTCFLVKTASLRPAPVW